MKPFTSLLILDDLKSRLQGQEVKPTGSKYFEEAESKRISVAKPNLSVPEEALQAKGNSLSPQDENAPTVEAGTYEPGSIKDEVEWGAKFAEPTEDILNSLVAPTKNGKVNSPTTYRDVPGGTASFNISKKTGKQINFGADFQAEEGEELINPFNGEAKVVKGLGLSGAGNSVSLEYTMPDGKKIYADLNHNQANLVKPGDVVKPGQVVAKAGRTGNATGVHSDFTVYSLDKNRNPIYFDTSKKFKG